MKILHFEIFVSLFSLLLVFISCKPETPNIKWNEKKGYRWTHLYVSENRGEGLQKLSFSDTGIDFRMIVTPDEIDENQILLNGTGVSTADIDNDGLGEIYFTQLHGENILYKNLGGFRFEDITEKAGVGHEGNYSQGSLFADVDGDGDQDLLVSTVAGENALYLNNGQGEFSKKSNSGLKAGQGSTTMTMADIDSDGDLDLFIANNKQKPAYDLFTEEELEPRNMVKRPEGKQIPGVTRYEFKAPFEKYYRFVYRKNLRAVMKEVGELNRLYVNDGSGHFTDVSQDSSRFMDQEGKPTSLKPEWSLTAQFQDINGDRLPDLYVCNDYFTPDRVWINQGEGYFKELGHDSIRDFSYSSMGVAASDVNRDGLQDLFVTEMRSQQYPNRVRQFHSKDMRPEMAREANYQPQYMKNSLYVNRGDSTFAELAYYAGLEASDWSWATRFLDLDLDGYEDLIVATGYPYDAIDRDYSYNTSRYKDEIDLNSSPPLKLRNNIFKNNGDITFTNVSEKWGFKTEDISYGLASADFDQDGDLDLIFSTFNERPVVYKNTSSASRIAVRLEGNTGNTKGIGAEVILEGGPVPQSKHIVSGGDYLSSSDHQITFAATFGNKNHKLTVNWPSGKQSIIDSVAANRMYIISEQENPGKRNIRKSVGNQEKIFLDNSSMLKHEHIDQSFDDWQIQPLLPLKLSKEGPGVMWMDYDLDQDDDLFITGGTGGALSIYENKGAGKFKNVDFSPGNDIAKTDQTSILGWETDSGTRIIVGLSNYEHPPQDPPLPLAIIYDIGKDGDVSQSYIEGAESSTGPMAAADYDADGDIDLFLGGRVKRGKYPADATSGLFVNQNGRFSEDSLNNELLINIGLVTGATFSDFDQDGDPDLLLSREWDSILLLENEDGIFQHATEKYGLNNIKGWWTSIETGDFNNDGLPDIVAPNMGLNSPYQIKRNHPLKLLYKDFDMDQGLEVIESDYSVSLNAYVPRRRLYRFKPFSSMIAARFASHREYANSSLDEILYRSLDDIRPREINTLVHTLFLNRGDYFEQIPLPVESQFSRVMDTRVLDYDNDGHEDLILSQNFFEVPNGMVRMDEGRGLLLKGMGTGQFHSVPGSESGIKITGQQRGVSISDFNKDGKSDLVITQNDSTTKLFRNTTPKRGLRVKLEGSENNIMSIGTSVRVLYKDGSKGPLREVKTGSGYLSQNSSIQVLGIDQDKEPYALQVDWFNGSTEYYNITPSDMDYTFKMKGIQGL